MNGRVKIRKVQILDGGGKEKIASADFWLLDGIDCSRVGCLPMQLFGQQKRYDNMLSQVSEIYNEDDNTSIKWMRYSRKRSALELQ